MKKCLAFVLGGGGARGASVHYVPLRSTPPVPLWDSKTHRDLFKIGYETMKNEMSRWPRKSQPETMLLRLFTKKQPSGTLAESDG